MTDKEVIVDGVDVGRCKYFGGYGQECSSEDLGMCSCDEHPDCLYKQLQAEKQKVKELEEKYKWYDHYKNSALYNKDLCNKKSDEIDKYKQALENLRNDIEQAITCESQECGCNDSGECLECLRNTVITKINEVLNDKSTTDA